jgi:hypothetical protein
MVVDGKISAKHSAKVDVNVFKLFSSIIYASQTQFARFTC